MLDYALIDEPDAILECLSEAARIGVDTEFIRERTYNAELCLLQVSTARKIYCIDPLTGHSMAGLWSAILDKPWVVHSARQDIEVVVQSAGRAPGTVFDTQIAAGLSGYPPQIGYATLVGELFGVEIAKLHTRANWSKRPIAEALLKYAAEDVEYLLAAYEVLAEKLNAQRRLHWAEEDSASLLGVSGFVPDPKAAVERLSGARYLRGRQRAAATLLAEWREVEAIRANRPRQWILRDAALLALASALPDSLDALQRIEGISPGTARRFGREVLTIIAGAGAEPQDYRPPAPPNERQRSLLKKMRSVVATRAGELGIAPEILATRKDLAGIVIGGQNDPRVLRGWRREVIGGELLALL